MSQRHHEQLKPEERVEQMVERLKQGGKRITPQRLAVLKALVFNPDHPSAEDIHTELMKSYPTMSLATVYKTLAMLKEEGEVLELGFSEPGNRYDGNKPYPHPHAVCNGCGAIMDLNFENLDEITKKAAAESGFSIKTHRLEFYGLCPRCLAK